MAQTLFGELLPTQRKQNEARYDWSDIIEAYKGQDAKSIAVMAAMLAAVPSMDKLQYQNLLEVTAFSLVNNVTTKESILVGLVWFLQFVPDETYLENSCLVGLLRLFIDQLNLAPDLMQPEVMAGMAIIAELLIARQAYHFDYVSSDLKAKIKLLRIQLATNLKKIPERYKPQYEYLDKLLAELVDHGQAHQSFRTGIDKTANLLFSITLGIMGVVGGLLYLSSPLGWSIAVATVASLALVSNFRKDCFDLFWSLKRAIEEPTKYGLPLTEFTPYQMVNQLILTTMGVHQEKDYPLSWSEIITVLEKLITQHPHIASYSASRLIDLTYSYTPRAVLVITPLTTFIITQIKNKPAEEQIWFSLLCHLKFKGSISQEGLDSVIGLNKKHESRNKSFCSEELQRLKYIKNDQRLWDFRCLKEDKLAAVNRVQHRWIKFKTYNYQTFSTGEFNLLPSHTYHDYKVFTEQVKKELETKNRAILLQGPSGAGKSVLTGITAESFNRTHKGRCIIRVFTFVLPTAGGLSASATQLHYEQQIELQYMLWAKSLAKKLKVPQILSNLNHRHGFLLEITRLLNSASLPWLLIVENIPDPLYWHQYHHQTQPFLMSPLTTTRAHGNVLIVSQKHFQQAEVAKHYSIIKIYTHNFKDEGFQLLNAIYPVNGAVEIKAAKMLVTMTNGLPAALAMAAVFIKHQCASLTLGRICSYEAYIQIIENYSAVLSDSDVCQRLEYPPAVVAIIKCSIGAIDNVAKRGPVDSLINFLCSIAASPVTYAMLHHHWQGEKSILEAPIELHEIIIIAERLNLLRRIRFSRLEQDTFIVPNLVYTVWSATLKELSSDVKVQYLKNMMFNKKQLLNAKKGLHEKFTLPHMIALLDSITQNCAPEFCEPRLIATYGAADTARCWGNNEEAARLYLSGLKQLEHCQANDQHYTDAFNSARFEAGLSVVENSRARPKSALIHGERAYSYYANIAEQKSAQGSTTFSLGKIHLELGDYQAAGKMFEDSLGLRKVADGEQSIAVANSYSGLGLLLSAQDRFSDAITKHQQAVAICETLNPQSHWTATCYHDYGVSLTAVGDYQSAINFHLKSLNLRELILGAGHHQVITGYNSIGCSYYFMGESLRLSGKENEANIAYNNALHYHEKALYRDINRYSLHHPYTLISLLNEARVLIRLKKNGNEIDQALRASERTLGRIAMPGNKMHVLWIMHYLVLAQRHEWQKRFSLAEENYTKALECAKDIFGNNHSQVASLYYYLDVLSTESGINTDDTLYYKNKLIPILSQITQLHLEHWLKKIPLPTFT